MSNQRLAAVFRPSQGRCFGILSGRGIVDLFHLGDVPGAQPLVPSLLHLASAAGFEVAMSVEAETGRTQLQDDAMIALFSTLAEGRTPPRPGEASKQAFQPRAREAQPAPVGAAATVTADVDRAAAGAFRNQLGRIERALTSGRKIFVAIEHPENLWHGDSLSRAALDEIKLLASLGRRASPAHPDSRVVFIVKPARLADFECALDRIEEMSSLRQTFAPLEAPGEKETDAFIERFALREGLLGSRAPVVQECRARGLLLINLRDMLRRVLDLPVAERRLDRALDSGERRESPEDVLAALDGLVGLAEIKRQARRLVTVARHHEEDRRAGLAVEAPATHMLFLGNPGTGKTEVARLMARLLCALRVSSSGKCVEISRTDIAGEYNSGQYIVQMRSAIQRAAGGVLFIDEAYQLAEGEWARSALETLMKAMEDQRGSLTVILAGYEDRMQELWRVNPGLRSRLPEQNRFHFPDYTSAELAEVFERICLSRGLSLESEGREAARRHIDAALRRGGFGNARGVRNLVDEVAQRCAECGARRVGAAAVPPPVRYDGARVDRLIQEIEAEFSGWRSLLEFLGRLRRRARAEDELGGTVSSPHCRFVGPPGTGKTTAARKLGALLHAMGILSRGELHEVNAVSQLMSPYAGEYATRVAEWFDRAKGGVLFLDEAYQLAEQEQGRQVLDQIVQTLTAPGFSDTVLILAGYRDRMNALIESNPGLPSRIPNEIVFEHLDPGGLIDIFHRAVDGRGYVVVSAERPEVDRRLQYRISELSSDPSFAGARTIKERLVEDVLDRQAQRVERSGDARRYRVLPEDVSDRAGESEGCNDVRGRLDAKFMGLDAVKERIEELVLDAQGQRARGAAAPKAPRLLFLGNPGTGKTSVARELGSILRQVGCTVSDRFAEQRGVELKGSFLGQTKDKVLAAFRDARGGLLFIDEAYQLQAADRPGGDSYAQEAVEALVGQTELPENRQTAIILAGYTGAMRTFLDANPGLASRFRETLKFPDYSTAECLAILERRLEADGAGHALRALTGPTRAIIEAYFEEMRRRPGFGNARDVETLADKILLVRNVRIARLRGEAPDPAPTAEDVGKAISRLEAEVR